MKEHAGEYIKQKSSKDLEKQVGVNILKIIKMTLRRHMILKENEGDHLNQNAKSKLEKCEKQKEQRQMEQEEPNLHTTGIAALQNKHPKTIVNEYNKRAGSQVITKKDKNIRKHLEKMAMK